MIYEGMTGIVEPAAPHLGGNIREGDAFTFAPSVWDYLVKRFAVRTVLDLGAGLGYSSHYFHNAGLQVIAVDGLPSNVRDSVFPETLVDLSVASVTCRVDLVHCQELVEHVEERHVENVLKSLTCGKFIVMTNALPGQGGYHHVNEQPTEYWIQHLRRYSCEVLVEDTNRVRALAAQDKAVYLARTGLVLTNKSF